LNIDRRFPSRHDRALPFRRRRRGERGAALVEFALVVPIFILLVMGIIDFANAFNDYNSVRQGVREGARQVVVAEWDIPGCTGTPAQKSVCLTKERIGLDAARTRVKIDATTHAPGEDVTVCAMYQARSITGMFSGILDNRTLRSQISMRIERIDGANPLTNTQETPLSGQDWSWC
jgi:hypothetical protein